ncbi:acyloxyacyl hydrolase [Lutibacter maritimus]|uniref:Lipid A 3-O-deacylase (PagL) n=1 Tax=Lutibacter maritimus TaxID=593133 RepID=A0A1I6Q1H3_9FLAO|nr:acyloxyacyl hydrolase [Lutibacter maritimus]SFS46273.1 Lipid A 3-O-deacylase (PagL) [Lutibacter maritimus]
MKKYFILLFFTVLASIQLFSQNNQQIFNSFQTDFFIGKPIEHDKKLNHAIQGNSFGILVSWNKIATNSSTFNKLYNYPEKGFSFVYQDFNSTILGEAFGVYRHYTYNLIPKNNHPLKLTTGFGLGYLTKKYNAITNPENLAIGSNLNVSAYIKLQYFQFLVQNKLSINTGLSLLHFSNVSIKNPNLGINTVSLHIGVNYKFGDEKNIPKKDIDTIEINPKPINYNLVLRGGFNESLIIDSGIYPFYTLSFYANKQLNNYSALTAGVDFFDSKFLKDHIEYINTTENKLYNKNDYRRAGIFVGHELTQNKFSFISQIGYTFYTHYTYVSKVYERFGFKHQLNNHLFSEISLKVNLFRAEALEFGIGYKF